MTQPEIIEVLGVKCGYRGDNWWQGQSKKKHSIFVNIKQSDKYSRWHMHIGWFPWINLESYADPSRIYFESSGRTLEECSQQAERKFDELLKSMNSLKKQLENKDD